MLQNKSTKRERFPKLGRSKVEILTAMNRTLVFCNILVFSVVKKHSVRGHKLPPSLSMTDRSLAVSSPIGYGTRVVLRLAKLYTAVTRFCGQS